MISCRARQTAHTKTLDIKIMLIHMHTDVAGNGEGFLVFMRNTTLAPFPLNNISMHYVKISLVHYILSITYSL